MKKLIGDKAFYRMVIRLVIPLVIQQGITSFVNLLDNVMVGGLGTESISAVAIVNQILMVFNLTIFGGLSGASIFGAQFCGKQDWDGQRHTFRFKLYLSLIVSLVGIGIFMLFGDHFISLFLKGESDGGDIALTLREGHDYMRIMLWGLVPFVLVQTYVGTLRETGETFAPMIASVTAILVNLALNYCADLQGTWASPPWVCAAQPMPRSFPAMWSCRTFSCIRTAITTNTSSCAARMPAAMCRAS